MAPPFSIYTAIGQKDRALAALEAAWQDHDAELLFVGVEPILILCIPTRDSLPCSGKSVFPSADELSEQSAVWS
jgi:hypothetical protein